MWVVCLDKHTKNTRKVERNSHNHKIIKCGWERCYSPVSAGMLAYRRGRYRLCYDAPAQCQIAVLPVWATFALAFENNTLSRDSTSKGLLSSVDFVRQRNTWLWDISVISAWKPSAHRSAYSPRLERNPPACNHSLRVNRDPMKKAMVLSLCTHYNNYTFNWAEEGDSTHSLHLSYIPVLYIPCILNCVQTRTTPAPAAEEKRAQTCVKIKCCPSSQGIKRKSRGLERWNKMDFFLCAHL